MPEPSPPFVRLATLDDAEAIRAIYNREVVGSTVTFDLVPRTLDDQRAWLAAHAGAHPAVVAVAGAAVVGFGSLSPYRDRPAYATTVEDSVYVHPEARGRGVGRALLAELVRLAEVHGFHAVMARIVGGHETSIALHEACGFVLVGVEQEVGRKFGRWLDVVLMQRLLAEDAAPRRPVLDPPVPST
ncbi:MAG TPA: GNAT family N-acetyltransferase [Acidimicrobiales bacterium]|nr:GNAT family N-acetyltransferase [Acidimicrobiales bacterium]